MKLLRKFISVFVFVVVLGLMSANKTEEVKTEDHCANAEYIPTYCVRFGEKYYFYEVIPKTTWLEAQHICRRNNGNLVTIESEAEMQALSDYFMQQKYNDYEDFGFWTAGSDLVNENDFMSIGSGNWLKYKKWANGQPKKGNHCIGIQATKDGFAMHTLNCDEDILYSYICELNTKGTMPYIKWNTNQNL